jgi:hypothetical protein
MKTVIEPVFRLALSDPNVLGIFYQHQTAPAKGQCRLRAIQPVLERALENPFKSISLFFERLEIHHKHDDQTAVALAAKPGQPWRSDMPALLKNLEFDAPFEMPAREPVISQTTFDKIKRVLLSEYGFAADMVIGDALRKLGAEQITKSQAGSFLVYLDVSNELKQRISKVLESV